MGTRKAKRPERRLNCDIAGCLYCPPIGDDPDERAAAGEQLAGDLATVLDLYADAGLPTNTITLVSTTACEAFHFARQELPKLARRQTSK